MRKWFVSLTLACCVSIALAGVLSAQVVIQVQAQPAAQVQPAQAKPIQVQAQPAQIQIQLADRAVAMPGIAFPGRSQLTQADAIFTGRVVGIEPMDVEAVQVPGTAKVKYRIAVVQVSESVFGLKKETKQVRVGFVVQGGNVPVGPGGPIQILPVPAPGQPQILPVQPGGLGRRRPFPGFQQMQLAEGQDGLFIVNSHPKEKFYLSPNFQNFVQRENNKEAFETQLKTAKQFGKVMADPIAGLKAEDKNDRYTAASILIGKYRNPSNPEGKPMKQEPIDAAESKLILQALAGGDWKVGVFNPMLPGPAELFYQLGVQAKDGFNPMPFRDQQAQFTALQKWLDENQGKYRIQRYVIDPTAKAPMPGVVVPGGDPRPGVIRPGIQPLPPIRIQPGQVQPPLPPLPPVQDLPALPAPADQKRNDK